MSYTPGPWRANLERRCIEADDLAPAEMAWTICYHAAGIKDETVEANLTLIAAAPALLEALKAVRPTIANEIVRGLGMFSDDQLKQVTDAIALASPSVGEMK